MTEQQKLFEMLRAGVTPFTCVEECEKRLTSAGFVPLSYEDIWKLGPGEKYIVNHHGTTLFAFTIGKNHELTRCSDDGEPAQTAGRPMLDVLLGEDVHNMCVIVTRYFGGTLLGTGGLVRAYSGAVKEGLEMSEIVEKYRAFEMTVGTDYTGVGKIQYILGQDGITILDSIYTDKVEFKLLVPVAQYDGLAKKITEGTSGGAKIEKGDEIWYGLLNKEVILFED